MMDQILENIVGTHEQLKPVAVKNLRFIVHPSFLIDNWDPFAAQRKEEYTTKTRENQKALAVKYLPSSNADFTFIMPHEEPSLDTWRKSKKLKVSDPDTVMWTDLYKTIKRGTQYPQNVAIIDNLAYYSRPDRVNQERADVEVKVIEKLQKTGLHIDDNTEITLGGEFRDVCIYEVAKKLLLHPDIKRVRIDKTRSFTTAYHYETEHELTKEDAWRNEDLRSSIKREYEMNEDEEYIFIKKK